MGIFSSGDHTDSGAEDMSDGAATAPSSTRDRGASPAARGGFLRSGVQRRFVPLLIALTLLSSLGMAGLAYVSARASAIGAAQTRTTQDVRVLRQLLADRVAGISSDNGRLVIGQQGAQIVLNGDTTIVDQARAATGAYAAIYQLQGPNLAGISSNVPLADAQGTPLPGTRLLGDAIGGPAYDALLGACGPTDTPSCHHPYSGIVTLHGVEYVAAYAPLDDGSGAFVGALAAAIPLADVLAPVTQQTVPLVLVALLLGMVALGAGYWVFESSSRRYFAALDWRLNAVNAQAARVSALARQHAARAVQQEHTAGQVGEQLRLLEALALALTQGHAGLSDSAGELWAEMSQPGTAPDPTHVAAQARQAAVVAAHVGTAAAQARDLCRQLALLLRHVIAQSRAAGESSHALDQHANELLEATVQAGATLAERLAQPRASDTATTPRTATGHHLALGTDTGAPLTASHRSLAPRPGLTGQTGAMPRVFPPTPRGEGHGHERRITGERPTYRPGMSRATGNFPAAPRPSSAPDTSGRQPSPPTAGEQLNRFGLPDLGAQDQPPDWRGGTPESTPE